LARLRALFNGLLPDEGAGRYSLVLSVWGKNHRAWDTPNAPQTGGHPKLIHCQFE
jgi:hypothetical protein